MTTDADATGITTKEEALIRREHLITMLSRRFAFRSTSRTKINRTLEKYSTELLEMLDQDMSNEGMWLIRQSVNSNNSESVLHEHLVFFPKFDVMSYADAEDFVRSLHGYHQLPQTDNLALEEPEVLEKCHALRIVIRACMGTYLPQVFKRGDLRFVLADDELVELIFSDTSKAEQIADIIQTRKTADVQFIGEILTDAAPAICEGVL